MEATFHPHVVRKRNAGEKVSRAGASILAVLVGLAVCVVLLARSEGQPAASSSSIGLLEVLGKGRTFPRASLLLQQLASNATQSATSNSSAEETEDADEDEGKDACPTIEKKDAFFVKQLFWSWVNTLEVSGVTKYKNGSKVIGQLGFIKSEPFSFVSEQAWRGPDGALIASSHQDAITTVTSIYVEDCQHRPMATVSEQMAGSSSAVSQYTIQNTDGDIIAISTMSRNFGTEVDINDQQSGKRFVTVSKGWGQWSDAWAATFRQGMPLKLANDPRVVVMLLSAASASGTWGLGGPFSILLSPFWLLMLFCCCCACCTALSRQQEAVSDYEAINDHPAPSAFGPGSFRGQGMSLGGGRNGGENIVRC